MLNWKVLPANIYIGIIICLSHVYVVRCQNPCVDKSSCKCTFKDGSVVDLSSLRNTDSTPRFKDVLSTDRNFYSFNPCYGFNEGSECTNAAICVTTSDHMTHILFAQPNDGSFQNDGVSKKLVLYYFNSDVGFFSLLLAYLIGGMVFMRFRKNARGLEILPNVTLWKSIPGLIKDGVMFSVGRPFRSANYQKI